MIRCPPSTHSQSAHHPQQQKQPEKLHQQLKSLSLSTVSEDEERRETEIKTML